MTGFTRHDLPADIDVFAGRFESQPAVFAHLLTHTPALDLTHVEVIQGEAAKRLSARFDEGIAAEIMRMRNGMNTLILILPAAYDGLDCPVLPSNPLVGIGRFRGRVPHMVERGPQE